MVKSICVTTNPTPAPGSGHWWGFFVDNSVLRVTLYYINALYYLDVSGRSYGAPPDGQAHENPEWEKARQALASITKSQTSSKTPQPSRTPAEVSVRLTDVDVFI